ncbi:hypothetical protein LS48_01285 [Aequorivita aquimaris]|uniref:Uncharacterized protein n=1 Tax=Aequorivita aquimaris TaxID=1548749 RepID=A0A137RLU1_9FLAO|nr:hypothetical protein LS48_01285 [Aequorivita aquimaris]
MPKMNNGYKKVKNYEIVFLSILIDFSFNRCLVYISPSILCTIYLLKDFLGYTDNAHNKYTIKNIIITKGY